MSKTKFTPADRKALALAAFLFYGDREYQVELDYSSSCSRLVLTVFFSKTQIFEKCPLLNWPFIECDEYDISEDTRISQWKIKF